MNRLLPGSFARWIRGLRHRRMVRVFTLILCLGVAPFWMGLGNAQTGPSVFVFVSTDIRARALQKELETVMSGTNLKVFSRYRELESAFQHHRPDAILTHQVVLQSLNLSPNLRGFRDGRDDEPYVLLSVGKSMTPSDLRGRKLGVVNLVGRQAMESFVSHVLGQPAPRLKQVNHERDLLPMLQMDMVVAVLVSSRWAQLLKDKSALDLRETPLERRVGLPALTVLSMQEEAQLTHKVKSMDARSNARLGVDQWK